MRSPTISAAWGAALFCAGNPTDARRETIRFRVNPLTRLIHVAYTVPRGAPDIVTVRCAWRRP
ncbi:MAG: hypothetical protein GXP31_02085, partial [Kiritimatiellaeota bacterium]|nr:hypothetical protein [Kiritimatiellota bacterium]